MNKFGYSNHSNKFEEQPDKNYSHPPPPSIRSNSIKSQPITQSSENYVFKTGFSQNSSLYPAPNSSAQTQTSEIQNILKPKLTNVILQPPQQPILSQLAQPSSSQQNYDEQFLHEEKELDSHEVKDLKSRMKIIMNKLNTTKREKESLAKENKVLQEEIMGLQSNLRSMIQGFSNNTSSNFPMQNELTVKIAEFYKYDCLDIFFDLLCSELNMKGIIFFFRVAFQKLLEVVQNYLQPSIDAIKQVGCFESLEGPIVNVLRKSYQQNFKQMLTKAISINSVTPVTDQIQAHLKLGGMSQETHSLINDFLLKLGEIIFFTQIADPPLFIDTKEIGSKLQFVPLKHDPFDGFIKPKEDCYLVIPSVHKGNSAEGDLIAKALVLQANYEIPG